MRPASCSPLLLTIEEAAMFAVYLTNFDVGCKGQFETLDQAIAYAKQIGFECSIFCGTELVKIIKTY